MSNNSRTDQVQAYLSEHPNEVLTNRQIAEALGIDLKVIRNSIQGLRTYRKLPIVRVARGKIMYKPDGIVSATRVQKRSQAKRQATVEAVTGERHDKRGHRISHEAVQAKRDKYAALLHRRSVVLYELMEAAPKHANGAFTQSIKALVMANPKARKEFIYGGKFAPGGVYAAHTYLLEIGAIRSAGPTYRYLVAHPDEIRPNMASGIAGTVVPEESTTVVFDRGTPETPVSATRKSKSERTVDAVDSVPSDDLAGAVAEAMWQRYEMAMTEIGRLHELLSVRDQEIARLKAQVDELPTPTVSDYARRMLASGKRR